MNYSLTNEFISTKHFNSSIDLKKLIIIYKTYSLAMIDEKYLPTFINVFLANRKTKCNLKLESSVQVAK